MSNTLKFGNGEWYGKEGTILAYNDENNNYKPLLFDFDRASSGTRVNKDGLIEVVGSKQPRVDYSNDSKGAFLLEPQSTNLIPYSEDFANASWDKINGGTGSAPVVTSNQGTAPNGTLTADRIVFDKGVGTSGSDYSLINETVVSLPNPHTITTSFYIKSNNGSNQNLVTYQQGSGVKNIVATNEWQRVELTATRSSTSNYTRIGLLANTDQTADILVWGAQLEQGSYLTSYIPTNGSTVTRVAETCSQSGLGSIINSSEGVLYVEIIKGFTPNAFEYLSLSDGTTSNTIRVFFNTSNQIGTVVTDGGVTQINTTNLFSYTQGENLKIALKYKENDFALWVNGTEIITENSGTVPSVDSLKFGRGDATTTWFEKTKDLRVYNTALSDSELKALTS